MKLITSFVLAGVILVQVSCANKQVKERIPSSDVLGTGEIGSSNGGSLQKTAFKNFNLDARDLNIIRQGIADSLNMKNTKALLARNCKLGDNWDQVMTKLNPDEIGLLPVAQNSDSVSNSIELYATAIGNCMGNKCQGYDTTIVRVNYRSVYEDSGKSKNSVNIVGCFSTGHSF